MKKTTVYRLLILLLVLHSVAYICVYTRTTLEQGGRLGGDFPTFYKRAEMTLAHAPSAEIYDTAPLAAEAAGTLDLTADPLPPFPYPPHLLLFLAPLGVLPYHAALACWLLLGAVAYLAATRKSPAASLIPPDCRLGLSLFILLSPLALYNIVTAQNGFFTAALLITAITLSERKPTLAGICAGLLTIKPQLGLMLPILFLAQKNKRAILAAMATIASLAALATLVFGPSTWADFATYLHAFTKMLAQTPGLLSQMNASLYRSLLINNLPESVALAAQAFVIAFAAIITWRTATSKAESPLRHGIILIACLLAAPHLMTYDMPALIVPVLYLLSEVLKGRERPYELLGLIFLLLSPILALHSPQMPLAFLAMLTVEILLARRLKA